MVDVGVLADRADGRKVTVTMEIYTDVPGRCARHAPQARPVAGRLA
jgi:hypothetical protein